MVAPLVAFIAPLLTGATLLSLAAPDARADDGANDVNIVVSLDRSESIDSEELRGQIDGLRHTLTHPRFLEAVKRGRRGRVGLSVVTWSSFARSDVILPWVRIASQTDAQLASAVLLQDLDRSRVKRHGAQTDVAFGIETGAKQFAREPWRSDKRLLNMVGDGMSNIGRLAWLDRDAALDAGITINALIIAQGSAIRVMTDYFKRNVIGGPAAFVHHTVDVADFTEAMLKKFLLELSAVQNAPRRRS